MPADRIALADEIERAMRGATRATATRSDAAEVGGLVIGSLDVVLAALRHDAGAEMREAAAREVERWLVPGPLPVAPRAIHERINQQNLIVPEIAAAIRALASEEEGSASR